MYYFGTNTETSGHYTWDLSDNRMQRIGLLPATPFDPERLTMGLPNGEVVFYQGGGYTVLAISGSPVDKRQGCKSVFWIKGDTTRSGIEIMIMQNKFAKQIIEMMPFKVKFNE